MAEQEKLIVEFSAETVGLVQAVATAENALQDFGKAGETSLEQIGTAFRELNKARKTSLDPEAIARLNRALQELSRQGINIRNLGINEVNTDLEKLSTNARQARITVYGLNQVVRDAPFGFIAISNNLPILFDQFGKLKSETGGTSNALKLFASTLTGPAGISIGISAVIGVITALVQQYGSLGKAIDAIIGSGSKLTEDQIKYTEQLGSEIAEIAVLVNAYPNLTNSRKDQEGILKKLNNIAPQYFKDLNTEKTTIDKLTESYDRYIKSFVAKIFIEQQTKQLEEVAKSYAQELLSLLEKEKAVRQEQANRVNATRRQIQLQEELAKSNQSLRRTGDIGIGVEILVKQPPKTFQELIGELTNRFKKNTTELLDAQKSFFQAIDFTGVFEQEEKESGKSTKKKIDDIEEVEKKRKTAIDKAYFNAVNAEIKTLQAKINIDKEYLSSIDATSQEALQKRLDILNQENEQKKLQLGKEIEDTKEYTQIVYDLDLQLVKDREAIYKAWADNRIKDIARVLEAEMAYIDATTRESAKEDPGGIFKGIGNFFKNLDAQNKEFDKKLQISQEQIKRFNADLQNAFLNFGENIVSGVFEGEKAIDNLKESFKELGKQIAIALVKFAVLKTIEAGLNAATGGTGGTAALPVLSRLIGAKAPAGITSGLQVGPGGLAIAGSVTFVQRGPDLVGVLTAANSRINRVG